MIGPVPFASARQLHVRRCFRPGGGTPPPSVSSRRRGGRFLAVSLEVSTARLSTTRIILNQSLCMRAMHCHVQQCAAQQLERHGNIFTVCPMPIYTKNTRQRSTQIY